MRHLFASILVASAIASPVAAVGNPIPLSDYIVTSWTIKDGLPSDVIWTIAQDEHGYLWLGTNGGLVRFDGLRFVTWDAVGQTTLPRVPVRSLFASRDGSLWAGFAFSETGGISRLHEGTVTTYGEREGLVRGSVNAILEDRAGVVWAGTNTGLFRLDGQRWRQIGGTEGMPTVRVDSLYLDRQGHLLVGTSAGVYRTRTGGDTFEQVDSPDDAPPVFRGFSEDREGRIWITDPVGGFRLLGDRRTPLRERGRGNTLLHDHDGSLWVTTMGEGIWRISPGDGATPRVEKARAPGARAIFEDRDGQIWAGNGDGLIRLAKPKVIPFTELGLVYGVQSTPDGAIWVTTPDSVLRAAPSGGARVFHEELHRPGIRTLRADEHGNLWVATSNGLVRFGAGGERTYPLPTGADVNRISSIASDGNGGLWISDRDRGLFSWNPAHDRALRPMRALGDLRLNSIFGDSNGRLWFAATNSRLGYIERGGMVHTFGIDSGAGTGPSNGFFEDSRHTVWVAGNDGVRHFAGDRFVKINQGDHFRGAIGMIEDADGDLWLGTGSGIVCVARAELDKAFGDPKYEVFARVFDAADGLAGMPVNFGNPTETRQPDGRIWFVTGRGVTAFDPRALKAAAPPALVRIEDIDIDGRPAPVGAALRLPAGTTRVAIDYSALDLTTPWRMRFRYRLDGFDGDWIDAGTHRQAVYTHLPPGDYRFRVSASNVDGAWSDGIAEWRFSMTPMFYQRFWFYASCVAALALCTWAAWQLRVRRIRRQFALLIGERARLSREIHDTLLQSLVGVALQFDALSANFDASSPERQQLVRIRKEVEEYIREARHSIWNLRKPVVGHRDLSSAIREAARRMAAGHAVALDFAVVGVARGCPTDIEEQFVRICQEAVLNAVRHGNPTTVRVELHYERTAIVLRVTDDGVGFDPDTTVPLEADGHYGLASMRERAAQAGGIFTLTTSRRAGTSIEARIPAGAQA